MDIKNYRHVTTLIAMVILISVLVVSTIMILHFMRTNSTPSRPTTPAAIVLKKVEFNETIEIGYVDIVESDLGQYPLLAKVLDAWKNPDKYENAYMWDNNTLMYNATDTEACRLTDFIREKLTQKYSEPIRTPYYIKYNQEFFSYQVILP